MYFIFDHFPSLLTKVLLKESRERERERERFPRIKKISETVCAYNNKRKTIFRPLSTDLICILKNQLKKKTFNFMMTVLLPLFDVELHFIVIIVSFNECRNIMEGVF